MSRPVGPLRLAFIAPGNSIHTRRWLEHFAREGHDVGLVSYGMLDRPLEGVELLTELGAFSRPAARLSRLVQFVLASLKVWRALRDFHPDLVHAHFLTGPAWLGLLAPRKAPFVVTAWGSDALVDAESVGVRLLDHLALRRAAYATCDAEQVGERLVRLGAPAARLRRTLWGVDVEQFSPGPADVELRRELDLRPQALVVLPIRGLRPLQNPLTILRAFAQLRASSIDAVLALKLGPADDGLPTFVRDEIRALGLGEDVRIVPSLPQERVTSLYRLADVCLSVPSTDGTSVALLEAMASGRAVVASDLPANREWIVHGETGLLVPVGDSAALAAAVASLADDHGRREALGEAARRRVVAEADARLRMAEVELLYYTAVSR